MYIRPKSYPEFGPYLDCDWAILMFQRLHGIGELQDWLAAATISIICMDAVRLASAPEPLEHRISRHRATACKPMSSFQFAHPTHLAASRDPESRRWGGATTPPECCAQHRTCRGRSANGIGARGWPRSLWGGRRTSSRPTSTDYCNDYNNDPLEIGRSYSWQMSTTLILDNESSEEQFE